MKFKFIKTIPDMKCAILSFVLFFGLSGFAQNDSSRWDLNKYVCSHAQNTQKPSQKPSIPLSVYKSWYHLGQIMISENGQYLMFIIDNLPQGSKTLTIKPIDSRWEKQIIGAAPISFSKDNGYATYSKIDGQFCQLNLITKEETIIQQYARPFESNPSPSPNSIEKLLSKRSLISTTGIIENISDYQPVPLGNGYILKNFQNNISSLFWFDTIKGKPSILWKGKYGDDLQIEKGNRHCNYVLFKIKERVTDQDSSIPDVDVWSYKDASDPSPFTQPTPNFEYYAINSSFKDSVVKISTATEHLIDAAGDFALIEERLGNNPYEAAWNELSRSSFFIVSLKDGKKHLVLKQEGKGIIEAKQNPSGRYILFADNRSLQYYSYDCITGELHIISKPLEIFKKTSDLDIPFLPVNVTWIEDDEAIVDDNYDLWKLDLTGKYHPVNITHYFGKHNNITFKLTHFNDDPLGGLGKVKGKILLFAFKRKTKDWGFYQLDNFSGSDPKELFCGPYYFRGDNPLILKANTSDVFFVTRETSKSSPNIFATKDFVEFKQVSNITPENDYNWMRTELIKWKTNYNKECDGTLYFPENFDKKKRYPVVVVIYNDYSKELNAFTEITDGSERNGWLNFLPTSWLASNGYIVFVPNLSHRKIGARLQDTYDMVVPGVKYLRSLPFINGNKIGLQGASWGGEQVNYLITHTNIFAAVFSGAGLSERISDCGFSDQTVVGNNQMHNEINYGGPVTEVPERYIKEAPLLYTKNIETPILLKHNKNDGGVAFYQSLQFFRALRRLGKKAWMLQYENGDHGILPGEQCDDMNLRISQFFNHYLKDMPPPLWMVRGVKSADRTTKQGLMLDSVVN